MDASTDTPQINRGPDWLRPDLVGLSLPTMDVTIAVEANGRTGGLDDKVIRKAKEQARSLPGVLSTGSALRVASVAFFGAQWRWEAYLEDPPGPVQPLNSLTPETLLAAYYPGTRQSPELRA